MRCRYDKKNKYDDKRDMKKHDDYRNTAERLKLDQDDDKRSKYLLKRRLKSGSPQLTWKWIRMTEHPHFRR